MKDSRGSDYGGNRDGGNNNYGAPRGKFLFRRKLSLNSSPKGSHLLFHFDVIVR